MTNTDVSLEARFSLCEADVTLNGLPAKVCGARNRFATVRQLSSGLSAEWSWVAVVRVVSNGGDFQS
jgi:hypothetical protein